MLNPAQQSVIDLLGRSPDREALAPELAAELEAELTSELEDLTDHLDPADPVWISKHALTTIHGCEAHHVAGRDSFAWTVASARGTVAHKAIEVMIHFRGDPNPPELVDEALARLADDEHSDVGRFVGSLAEFDRAELRALAVDRVAAFQESFPPLRSQWAPRTESKSRVDLLGGRIVLSGKSDLTLGRPPDKVIIDLKTGRPARSHREDLRFYALVEAIKLGSPPRKVASYYLDAARTDAEDVTEGTLRAAAHRTVVGTRRIVELTRLDQDPTKRPGPQCRWCTLFAGCAEGRASMEPSSGDDADADPGW